MMPTVGATILARLTIWIWGGYAIWQGQGIIEGGEERLSGPAFALLRTVPNAPLAWGLTLIGSGLLILTGSLTRLIVVKGIGLAGMAIWSLCLAKGSFEAADLIPTAAATGGRTYVAIAMASIVLIFVNERKASPTCLESTAGRQPSPTRRSSPSAPYPPPSA